MESIDGGNHSLNREFHSGGNYVFRNRLLVVEIFQVLSAFWVREFCVREGGGVRNLGHFFSQNPIFSRCSALAAGMNSVWSAENDPFMSPRLTHFKVPRAFE